MVFCWGCPLLNLSSSVSNCKQFLCQISLVEPSWWYIKNKGNIICLTPWYFCFFLTTNHCCFGVKVPKGSFVKQIFWESGMLQLCGLSVEYYTSRGPPPYQRASWAEKPSCGGRWKKRQASFKKLKQQGDSGTETSHGQSRHAYDKKQRALTAASVRLGCC